MKKATKEKKTQNQINNKNRIFDYDQETKQRPEKLTRKANSKNKNEDKKKYETKKRNQDKKKKETKKRIETRKKEIKNNIKKEIKNNIKKERNKKIKQIQKKKKIENSKKNKEIKAINKIENKKVARKLTINEIRKKQRINKTIKTVLLICIAIVAILLLLLSPIFNIKEVKIEGNNKISRQEILSLLKIGKDTNIFKVTDNYVKEKLKENAYIDIDETISRKIFPETIEVHIKERSADFQLEFGSSFAYIDKYGNILEISPKSLENKIKILGYKTSNEKIKPGNKLEDRDILKINDIMQITKIAQNYGIDSKITSINIEDDNDYILYLDSEKKTVHLGNNIAIETKMLYIKAILEREKEIEGEIFVNMDLNKKNAYFKQKV
ncbi:MAG: FtsQ-type POTRA domain-containing protein [Clostridia bacterium]|nr:FtsQ-type POTRA domain-containing protein [Clostridia bacterium]